MSEPFSPAAYVVPAVQALPSNAAYTSHLRLDWESGKLVRAMANESTLLPSPRVREALQRAYESSNFYPAPLHPLRGALAEWHGVSPESLLLGAGGSEVVDAVIRAVIGPDDEALLPAPTWPVYERRVAASGGAVVSAELTVENDQYRYDVDAIVSRVTERTKLIVACTPNNPTGNLLSVAELRRLAAVGPPVLVDLAYCDFAIGYDPQRELGVADNVVYSYTFSKGHSLAGLRVGYLVGGPELLDYVERVMLPGSSISSASLDAALAALDDEAYYRRQIGATVSERERLVEGLRQAGLRTFASQANFVAVEAGSLLGGAEAFVQAMFAGGIVIRHIGDGLARITVGTPEDNDRLLARVRELFSQRVPAKEA